MSIRTSAVSGERPAYPPAPDGRTMYVIGDVHGRRDLLDRVHHAIDRDVERTGARQTTEIYLGDYIDRGPDSAGAVARLIRRAGDVETAFLRGNHEQILLDFIGGENCWNEWKSIGAQPTLLSYGVPSEFLLRGIDAEAVRSAFEIRLPEDHVDFYSQALSYYRAGPYLMVHAGLRPGIALEEQSLADLLGIRHEFLEFEGDFGVIVVHGHTPVMAPDLRPNRINIDTGAFATNRLTCLCIGGGGARLLAV